METVQQDLTDEGLQIPRERLEQAGWRSGQRVMISITPAAISITRPPDLEALVLKRAHHHLMVRVGDATATGPIEKRSDGWRVPVYLSYRDLYIGELIFNSQGDLVEDESSSYEEMLARANAG